MHTNRLTALFLQILNRKALTAPALAKRFKVDINTIYQDLETLQKAGLPLVTTLHRAPCGEEFASYSIKGDALCSVDLSHIFSRLLAAPAQPAPSITTDAFPDLIETAIALQKPLALTYIDKDGNVTHRQVEPVIFSREEEGGFLYAYCQLREAFRHFNLSGIQALALTDGSFTHPFDPQEFLAKIFGDEQEDEPYFDILFTCEEALLDEVFLTFEEGVEVLEESAGGKYLMSLFAPLSPQVLGFFMGFGRQTKVLAPQECKDLLKEKARELLGLY